MILARRRMSAAELSRRTGIRQQALSRRMTGETAFDLDDLEVIAAELGVAVKDLLGGDGAQTTVPSVRMPERPRDNRPNGRPGKSAPTPTSRRPARIGPPATSAASPA